MNKYSFGEFIGSSLSIGATIMMIIIWVNLAYEQFGILGGIIAIFLSPISLALPIISLFIEDLPTSLPLTLWGIIILGVLIRNTSIKARIRNK